MQILVFIMFEVLVIVMCEFVVCVQIYGFYIFGVQLGKLINDVLYFCYVCEFGGLCNFVLSVLVFQV